MPEDDQVRPPRGSNPLEDQIKRRERYNLIKQFNSSEGRKMETAFVLIDVESGKVPEVVSEFFGKSKLITTLTAWISIPLVKRSAKGEIGYF